MREATKCPSLFYYNEGPDISPIIGSLITSRQEWFTQFFKSKVFFLHLPNPIPNLSLTIRSRYRLT